MGRFVFVAVIAVIILGACTAIKSTRNSNAGLGIAYFLPTTRIPITVALNRASDTVKITAGEPRYIPDERFQFMLSSIFSPFHKDIVDLKVNAVGLLSTANVTSESELSQIAQEGAKSLGSLATSASLPATDEVVYQTEIDVEDLAGASGFKAASPALSRLNKEINVALRNALAQGDVKQNGFLSSLRLRGGKASVAVRRVTPVARLPEPDCSIGLCYRMPVAYLVGTTLSNGQRREAIVTVPNGSATYAAALNRGGFAKWVNTMQLTNGMLTGFKYETDGSELLGAVKLPFEVVGASIAAIGQRTGSQKAQTDLLKAQAEQLKAQTDLLAALEKLEQAREARQKAVAQRRGLFEFSFGRSAPRGGTPGLLQLGADTADPAAVVTDP